MKKRSLLSVVAASMMMAALTANTTAAQAQQQFTMKLSTSTTNDALVEWLTVFKKNIEARSGGRIKAEVYSASQLGSIPRTIEGVAMGTIEVSMNASGFFEGIEPRYAVFAAPGIFDSLEHGNAVIADPAVQARLATFGASKNVQTLTALVTSSYAFVSHKPINTLADFKGQKIRVPGSPIQLDTMKRLGALPLSMPLGEVLPALQNKTIDGVYAGPPLFTAFKYYDVAKNMTMVPSGWAVAVAMINRNFLKSLGPELEKMVWEEARNTDKAIFTWAAKDIADSKVTWEKNGGTQVSLPAADAKKFIEESTAGALPLLTATPVMKEDFQTVEAASKKARSK